MTRLIPTPPPSGPVYAPETKAIAWNVEEGVFLVDEGLIPDAGTRALMDFGVGPGVDPEAGANTLPQNLARRGAR